jgi:hypothetical protein
VSNAGSEVAAVMVIVPIPSGWKGVDVTVESEFTVTKPGARVNMELGLFGAQAANKEINTASKNIFLDILF